MEIHQIEVGPFEVNCYLLQQGNKALVLDPGADAERIIDFIKKRRLEIAAYLLTHGHVDHVGAVADLYDAYPAPISMHKADLEWAFNPANCVPPMYLRPRRPETIANVITDDFGQHTAAGMKYSLIATPGHSPGSVCYLFPASASLFSGDTLFQGTVGRTDLPGGNEQVLRDSLGKLAGLPETTRIYPGHGPTTNLAAELRGNPFMKNV